MVCEEIELRGFMNIVILIALVITVWIGGRFYSNRHNLSCPAWLSWMIELDNPFVKSHKASEVIQMLPLQNSIMNEIGFAEDKFIGNKLAYTSHFKKQGNKEWQQ